MTPIRSAAVAAALATLAVLLAACGGGLTAGGLGAVPGAATPRTSAGPSAAAAIEALTEALAEVGITLAPAIRPWQPSQPASFTHVPRSTFQAGLADPDDGVVVVYEFATTEAAAAGGDQLAAYLASGPGRINFPGDAELHVAHLGPAVILTWLAPATSGDVESARAVYELMAGVGIEHPVGPQPGGHRHTIGPGWSADRRGGVSRRRRARPDARRRRPRRPPAGA